MRTTEKSTATFSAQIDVAPDKLERERRGSEFIADRSHLVALAEQSQLTLEQVHVRTMWVVSDQVNSYGGVIPNESHSALAGMLIGAPVLVGHQTDSLPIARIFAADRTERNGVPWVKAFFYWLRESEGAETLRANIDGGIYKECSISFMYSMPGCVLCGQDIRECGHEPHREYRIHGRRQVCTFRYEGISKVLECSLVYRGAIPDTLVSAASASSENLPTVTSSPIASLEELPGDDWYLVTPRYDGIRVHVSKASSQDMPALIAANERQIECTIPIRSDQSLLREPVGLLVGYRNRSRVSRELLVDALETNNPHVTRIVLYLLPDKNRTSLPLSTDPRFEIRVMPYATVNREQLADRIAVLSSRNGVELWPWTDSGKWKQVFQLSPDSIALKYSPSSPTEKRSSCLHSISLTTRQYALLQAGNLLITNLSSSTDPAQTSVSCDTSPSISKQNIQWHLIRHRGHERWGLRFGSTLRTNTRTGEKHEHRH